MRLYAAVMFCLGFNVQSFEGVANKAGCPTSLDKAAGPTVAEYRTLIDNRGTSLLKNSTPP